MSVANCTRAAVSVSTSRNKALLLTICPRGVFITLPKAAIGGGERGNAGGSHAATGGGGVADGGAGEIENGRGLVQKHLLAQAHDVGLGHVHLAEIVEGRRFS